MHVLFVIWFVTAAVAATCPLPRYPPQHTHACTAPNNAYPFCDTSLPVQDRVMDLISRMTLSEKIANRYDMESEIDRLGLPIYNWNQEGLHGLGALCFCATNTSGVRCPTIFAAPPTLAASFNVSLLLHVGDAISTEARAYNNNGGNRGYQDRAVDLNAWLPSVNIARDPRWGRQVETFSEDPYATGELAASMVRGAQQGRDGGASGNGYLKLIVAVKHATAYQVEADRFGINENISLHDLVDTFYPAWESVVEQGDASGFMCAYPAVNGVPMCGNAFFETQLMRATWGLGSTHQGGSYIQGDCGAISNIAHTHHYAVNETYAAAIALNAGTDVDCGTAFPSQLQNAIDLGLTTEEAVDASLARTYTLQMLAGRFDPVAAQPYMQIPFEDIDSLRHREIAFESGLQGMVLLRNDGDLLPLRKLQRVIAVIGPLGNTSDLAGNYYEMACPDNTLDCIPTVLSAVMGAAPAGSTVAYSLGVQIIGGDTSGISAAVALATTADVVIMCLGTNASVAQEGHDRNDTSLPGAQHALAAAILAVGKPTVVLLFNGGTMAIDDIVAATTPQVAIVECFFPGARGGLPVAAHLFGTNTNRWGKLPVTYYPADYFTHLAITDMSMTASPGRTYKYYAGPVLYPFGFGLSYTTFALSGSCPQRVMHVGAQPEEVDSRGRGLAAAAVAPITCEITVTNTGSVDGDEVVFLFVTSGNTTSEERRRARRLSPDPFAIKQLAAFQRVTVRAGGHAVVSFNVSAAALAFADDKGRRVVYGGQHGLEFSRGHGDVLRFGVSVVVDGGDAPQAVVRQYP